MAKPINLKNPVAAVRAHLRMALEDFAAMIDYSPSSLKLVECGSRPVNDALAKKIALKTGVPIAALKARHWSAADRAKYEPRGLAAMGWLDDLEPLRLVPSVLALYYCLVERGIDGRAATMALGHEITETAKRFGVDERVLSESVGEMECALFGVSGDGQGVDKPAIDAIAKPIAKTRVRGRAERAYVQFCARLEKLAYAERGARQGLLGSFIDETMARARRRAPKSETGAFARLVDNLPAPAKRRKAE